MTSNEYTISELQNEITSTRKQIRASRDGRRVYFETPFFQATDAGHMRLVQTFRVADGKGYFDTVAGSPEQEWSVAL